MKNRHSLWMLRNSIIVILVCTLMSCDSEKQLDIQGHRGCRGLYPENSLPAFEKAIALGVTTLELDIAITKEKEEELFNKIKSRYDNQVSPYYAAARLWTDAIIDPLDTRTWISMGIEAANHAPIEKPFNLGVLQV